MRGTARRGGTDPPQGWVSDAFGRKQAAPALCYRTTAALPAALIVVIAPQASGPAPEASRLDETADFPEAVGLRIVRGGTSDFILLAPGDGRIRTFGPFTSDARAAVRR